MTGDRVTEIEARIADCMSYNFGMRSADKLAHEDAPYLLAELAAARARAVFYANAESEANQKFTKALDGRDFWKQTAEQLRNQADVQAVELADARAKLAAVEALHQPTKNMCECGDPHEPVCAECPTDNYPCPTIAALHQGDQ